MKADLRFLIVDDHAMVRRGLRMILSEEWPSAVFGEAGSVPEMLQLLRKGGWDIVLLDINLPGRSGLDALTDLRHEFPRTPVLVLSGHAEDQYALRVLRSGAAGYITKESAPDELMLAINKVLEGGRHVTPALAEKLLLGISEVGEKPVHERLSDREFQVLCLIASGKTPSEIAEELTLSIKTISTFRARILEKLKMRTNAELTTYAIKHQLV